PSKREVEARNLLAIKSMPSGSAVGYQLLDDTQTLGVTEFDKRVRFLRALSGEIENAIKQFKMVADCKVQIVLPEQRLFAVTQPPVTASILIRIEVGSKIKDEGVFGIIQLVANAVENLQIENVSVIDTNGRVLSEGIFERLAQKRAGFFLEDDGSEDSEEAKKAKALKPNPEYGQPIMPDYEEIEKWYEIKENLEKSLEAKVTRQVMGILPLGSYKVAINADLGPLKDGEIADIKRMSTSIVVDNNNDDVYLDAVTKKQIFNTVASVVGYRVGRDNISLSKADFTLLSDADKRRLESLKKGERDWGRLGLILGGVLAMGGGLMFLWRRLRKKPIEGEQFGSEEDREANFDSLQDEMNGDRNLEKLKGLAGSDPDLIGQIMEDWLKDEVQAEASPELDEAVAEGVLG
ncbi:MAG: flagellar biosynthesis/type III secretory pathway M-ring protein FliF/YscJ, partial [Candidatus Marinamargulisbacteria bacterium]